MICQYSLMVGIHFLSASVIIYIYIDMLNCMVIYVEFLYINCIMGWDSDICSIFVIDQVYSSSWKQSFELAQTNLASVN